jgi:hypothetical protein
MWTTYIAPHQDPKKMVKRKEAFLALDKDKKQSGGISDYQKEMFIKEYKKWQEVN